MRRTRRAARPARLVTASAPRALDQPPATEPTPKTHKRRAVLAAAAVGVVAGLVSLRIVPPSIHELGPASVSARAALAAGGTLVRIPPLGAISASTHSVPLRFELAFDSVDFETLGPLATSARGRYALQQEIERDLRGLVLRAAVRFLLGAAVAGAIAAALVWHRRLHRVIGGAAGGAVGSAVAIGISLLSYNVEAFEQPRFTGTLARAPEVIQTVQRRVGVLDELRSRFETATRRLSGLLVLLAEPDIDPQQDSVAILHVSDIHGNPIGIEIADELAREFQVDAVLDTGDMQASAIDTEELTRLSGPIDQRLASLIERVPVPYLFVPGNHDSPQLLRALREADNVTVMGKSPVTVVDVEILGWPDPTFTTDPGVSQDEKDEIRLRLGADEVAPAVEAIGPDLLAVHDERLAEASVGIVPLIAAGHIHDRAFEEVDGTTIVTVGSTGATGLKSFTAEAGQDYEAEILYLRDARLVAIDYVSFEGTGGDFVIERQTIEPDEGEAGVSRFTPRPGSTE